MEHNCPHVKVEIVSVEVYDLVATICMAYVNYRNYYAGREDNY